MLDFHIEQILINVLSAYAQNETAFKALFGPFSFDPQLLDDWWQEYSDHVGDIEVRLAFWARQPKSLPVISIQLLDEDVEEGFMGNIATLGTDGIHSRGAAVKQMVQVTIAAQTPALLRTLTQVIRSGLFLMSNDLMRAGYSQVVYEGLDALALEEQLVAESLSMQVRRFVVEALCQVVAPDLIDSSNGRVVSLLVAASNITPPGGLTPDV